MPHCELHACLLPAHSVFAAAQMLFSSHFPFPMRAVNVAPVTASPMAAMSTPATMAGYAGVPAMVAGVDMAAMGDAVTGATLTARMGKG
ncbi:hypothetical protein EON67_10315, partial [archaeon]